MDFYSRENEGNFSEFKTFQEEQQYLPGFYSDIDVKGSLVNQMYQSSDSLAKLSFVYI